MRRLLVTRAARLRLVSVASCLRLRLRLLLLRLTITRILCANRDEYLSRPTAAAHFHHFEMGETERAGPLLHLGSGLTFAMSTCKMPKGPTRNSERRFHRWFLPAPVPVAVHDATSCHQVTRDSQTRCPPHSAKSCICRLQTYSLGDQHITTHTLKIRNQ